MNNGFTLTLDEWIFALGIYPSFNAIERYSFLSELVNNEWKHKKKELYRNSKIIKKLSTKRKASFYSFLDTISIQNEMHTYLEKNISWVNIFSSCYPHSLKQIHIPPIMLFYKGSLHHISNY